MQFVMFDIIPRWNTRIIVMVMSCGHVTAKRPKLGTVVVLFQYHS
jgi:hypothetical protein